MTPECWGKGSCSFNAPTPVFQSRFLRGRLFTARLTSSRSSAGHRDKSDPLGNYWRNCLPVFLPVGRVGVRKEPSRDCCEGEPGADGEFFRSQVSLWRNPRGSFAIVWVNAVFMSIGLYLTKAEPFFNGGVSPKTSMPGS